MFHPHTCIQTFPTPPPLSTPRAPQEDPSHDALWAGLAALPPGEQLPQDLPERFYFDALSYVRSAQYADRLAEWARHLPAEK